MSKLSDAQIAAVRQWAEEGANLNTIQANLKEQLGVVLTYFDTRMLVMELGVTLVDKKKEAAEKEAAEEAAKAEAAALAEASLPEEAIESYPVPEEESSTLGKLQVQMDEVALPHMIASGYVVFSDGQSSRWTIDESGRLGLSGVGQGYQPPAEDIPLFQQELHRLLGWSDGAERD